jgi:hypothetical protein
MNFESIGKGLDSTISKSVKKVKGTKNGVGNGLVKIGNAIAKSKEKNEKEKKDGKKETK